MPMYLSDREKETVRKITKVQAQQDLKVLREYRKLTKDAPKGAYKGG